MTLRVPFSLLMALILSMTSVTAAVAHMRAGGAAQIVICGTPGVEEVVTLDSFGDPIEAGHHCPDCLTVTADVLVGAPGLVRPAGRVLDVAVPPDAGLAVARAVPLPAARGPPTAL
jgi:hypothetical protein